MKPLPPTRYEYAEWSKAKVGIDYHADGDGITTASRTRWWASTSWCASPTPTVECFFKGRRVAAHVRSYQHGQAHDAARAHAECAPQAHEVDAGAAAELGPEHRRRHPRRRAVAAREPAAPRAGLPRVPGAAEPVQDLRRGAPGGGLPPGARHRLPRTANASSRSSKPSSISIRTSSPQPTRRLPRPRARTTTCAAPITSVTQRPDDRTVNHR